MGVSSLPDLKLNLSQSHILLILFYFNMKTYFLLTLILSVISPLIMVIYVLNFIFIFIITDNDEDSDGEILL